MNSSLDDDDVKNFISTYKSLIKSKLTLSWISIFKWRLCLTTVYLLLRMFRSIFWLVSKILSFNWSSKSFEAFVVSNEPHSKSDTSDKINTTWSHTRCFSTWKHQAQQLQLAPTNLSRPLYVHLCGVPSPDEHATLVQEIALFNQSNTTVVLTPEMCSRCRPSRNHYECKNEMEIIKYMFY